MPDIKVVKEESLHETIADFIREGDHIIADIDEMKDLICLKSYPKLLKKFFLLFLFISFS